tara:strand:- start:189 stop:404 length:216 start_codon:yes stop_codon:yes gene_type:complete
VVPIGRDRGIDRGMDRGIDRGMDRDMDRDMDGDMDGDRGVGNQSLSESFFSLFEKRVFLVYTGRWVRIRKI